jgi:quinol monooxygenase YgiN
LEQNFNSEYGSVCYLENKNAVLLTWKKFACLNDYREHATFALELMKKYPKSNFVIDARDGFEVRKEDIEWGFSFLLPEMSKTDCKKAGFILSEEKNIKGEIDNRLKEFGKYFAVFRAASLEEVLYKMEHMIWVDVAYVTKSGKREEFYSKLLQQGIITASRREPGNCRYDYSIPTECNNELYLTEIWTDAAAQKLHSSTEHYRKLALLKNEYVEQVKISKYAISSI